MVYYNYRNGMFSQYRGNGEWGGVTVYYRDAKTTTRINRHGHPPWYIHNELIGIPEPMESNIMTKTQDGIWISRRYKDTPVLDILKLHTNKNTNW